MTRMSKMVQVVSVCGSVVLSNLDHAAFAHHRGRRGILPVSVARAGDYCDVVLEPLGRNVPAQNPD
jgi:hypothetical protein